VVIPTLDPDERVNGRGVRILRDEGVDVEVGGRVERAMLLNMTYFKRVLDLGVTVTLKMAVTLDGRIASRPGSRDQISGEDAHRFVHRLRAAHDAVLVGINTLLVDSPCLDCRLLGSQNAPAAVVMDSTLRFPKTNTLLADNRTVVVMTTEGANEDVANELTAAGATVRRCASKDDRVGAEDAIGKLRDAGMTSCLVEGGCEVFSSFADAGIWDGLHVFVSPSLFGVKGVALSNRRIDREQMGAVQAGVSMVAGDVLMSYVNEKTRRRLLEHLLRDV
jgi:diaminohydroxyphosphoribosylaminopyrimidine deaminase/5-amino-6-(5-phosphoribosylamino)uracil reductase